MLLRNFKAGQSIATGIGIRFEPSLGPIFYFSSKAHRFCFFLSTKNYVDMKRKKKHHLLVCRLQKSIQLVCKKKKENML